MVLIKMQYFLLFFFVALVSLIGQKQQEITITGLSADHGLLPQVGYEFSLSPKNSLYTSIGYTTESASTGKVIGMDTTLLGPGFPIEIFDQVNTNILLIDLGYKLYFKPRDWHNHRFYISTFLCLRLSGLVVPGLPLQKFLMP